MLYTVCDVDCGIYSIKLSLWSDDNMFIHPHGAIS